MAAPTWSNTFVNNEQQRLWMANQGMAVEYGIWTTAEEIKVTEKQNNDGIETHDYQKYEQYLKLKMQAEWLTCPSYP